MITAAAKRNEAFLKAGMDKFMQVTLESLEKFDKVFAMRVRLFHDQPDLAHVLAERWLSSDGRFFVDYDEPQRE